MCRRNHSCPLAHRTFPTRTATRHHALYPRRRVREKRLDPSSCQQLSHVLFLLRPRLFLSFVGRRRQDCRPNCRRCAHRPGPHRHCGFCHQPLPWRPRQLRDHLKPTCWERGAVGPRHMPLQPICARLAASAGPGACLTRNCRLQSSFLK